MARIYVTDKNEVRELTCKSDGIDFMDEILGGSNEGNQYGTAREDSEWQMPEEDFCWWQEWAWREERILDRANEFGEEAIDEMSRLASEYDDPDALHDAQERYLGIRN